jgi:cysteine desulfurase
LPDLAASTGSACHAGSTEVSPVLAAMGVPEEVGWGAIRFSLGRSSSRSQIDAAIEMLVGHLREAIPARV